MPYCNLIDIKRMVDEAVLISLTDDEDSGDVVSSVVDAAISDADAMIDTYLAGKYSVPISPTPSIVRKLSVDIALYNLFSRRGRVSEATEQRYKDAVSMLRDVSKGNAAIAGATDAPEERSDDVVIITNSTRLFSRSSMAGF